MEIFVEGHAINTYVFCPRRCFYEYVEKVFYHNVYTVHGQLLHQHVDTMGREKRADRELYRSLFLYSQQHGFVVRCDVVEEANGEIYPVEYKRGKQGDWENNQLQLCAQGMALEEAYQLPVEYGYLFFYGSQLREKIVLDSHLREKTIATIEQIRGLYHLKQPPAGIDDWKKCRKCSLVEYCLPMERNTLKGKVAWERFI
jgi:CRISPR-associated exonuclease Cas4